MFINTSCVGSEVTFPLEIDLRTAVTRSRTLFLTKTHRLASDGLYDTPWSHMDYLHDGRMRFFGLQNKNKVPFTDMF